MAKKPAPANPTIVRAKHDASNRWFLTLRSTAQDSRLSFEARGILWYLLSKSDDWTVQIDDLRREGDIGRDKAKKALIELADAGYLERPKRFKDESGKWDWTPYVLYESPDLSRQDAAEDTPLTENPSTENQLLENRPMESQSILKNTEDRVQKEKDSTPEGVAPDADPASYAEWMDFLHKEFKVGKTAQNAGYLYSMFKNRAVRKGYKEYNISPPVPLAELKQWVAHEKRKYLEDRGKAEFVIRRPETINSKFLYWREKRAAVEAEKIVNAEFERLTA